MSALPRPRKTLNKPLLRRVAMRLRRLRHEEHYNQGVYIIKTDCGTAACVAGWLAMTAGWRLVGLSKAWYNFQWQKGKHTTEEDVSIIAERLLGAPSKAANDLFDFRLDQPFAWPPSYKNRWAEDKERKSRIAADLLDAIADGKVLATDSGLVEVETANG